MATVQQCGSQGGGFGSRGTSETSGGARYWSQQCGGHSGLYNWALIKTVDTKLSVSFAGWRAAVHGVPKSRTRPRNWTTTTILCAHCFTSFQGKLTRCTPQLETPGSDLFWTLPHASPPLAHFHLYYFTVIHYHSGLTRTIAFSKFCETFWQIIETEVGLGSPQTCTWGSVWGWSFGQLPSSALGNPTAPHLWPVILSLAPILPVYTPARPLLHKIAHQNISQPSITPPPGGTSCSSLAVPPRFPPTWIYHLGIILGGG